MPIAITKEQDVNVQLSAAVGTKIPTKVVLTGGDVTINFPCKLITSTEGTVVMVDMTDSLGQTLLNVPIPAGIFPVINVTKIKQTGTDAVNILVWPVE